MRTIYCSACGTAWAIDRTLSVGRAVRCQECFVVFPVPGTPKAVPVLHERAPAPPPPHEGTPARVLNVADFPTDLREAIGPPDTEERTPDASEAPTRPSIPVMSKSEAERRAFDLDERGRPRRRTGARVLRVPDAGE